MRDVRLFLVTITEISLLFLRVYFANLNDKIVRNARDVLNSLAIMRIRRLRLAHVDHLLGCDPMSRVMNLLRWLNELGNVVRYLFAGKGLTLVNYERDDRPY